MKDAPWLNDCYYMLVSNGLPYHVACHPISVNDRIDVRNDGVPDGYSCNLSANEWA